MKPSDLFSEFTWAVPKAFSAALRDCRFEQGDMLYDTVKAYEGTWKEALPQITYSLQVKYPPRSMGTQKKDAKAASKFASNWSEPITLDFTSYGNKQKRLYSTTQGKLYTLLWQGDPKILEPDSPKPPIPSTEFDSTLQSAAMSFFTHKLPAYKTACSLFILPDDETNDLQSGKHVYLREVFLNSFLFEFSRERATTVTSNASVIYSPTFYISAYCIQAEIGQVAEAVKEALYVPVKDKHTDRENWDIQKHGLLLVIPSL